jgi:hypothetical protein
VQGSIPFFLAWLLRKAKLYSCLKLCLWIWGCEAGRGDRTEGKGQMGDGKSAGAYCDFSRARLCL